jgi:hypothetical protein
MENNGAAFQQISITNNSFQIFISCITLTTDQIICSIRRVKGVISQVINESVCVVSNNRKAGDMGQQHGALHLLHFCYDVDGSVNQLSPTTESVK